MFYFTKITNNPVDANPLPTQLAVDVTFIDNPTGSDQVSFKFFNYGPIASSIAQIYFDDLENNQYLSTPVTINNELGVGFVAGATPADLPGGNNISPSFSATQVFNTSANNPAPTNGVNPGEFVELIFDLTNNYPFAQLISELQEGITGDLRLAMHVISIPYGTTTNSNSYVHTPIPGSVLLLGSGLLGLGLLGWRRKNRA